jgi:tripartite-type tricarboxylate transporter receptor subunit TctC
MTRLGSNRTWIAVSAAIACFAGLQGQAAAQSVADFYKGKIITITVGSGAGGGYDTHARLVARHLGKTIPGNPTLIVQNMPGGEGLTQANHLYNISLKDGSAMGVLQRLMLTAPYLNPQQVKYDGTKFNWIGSLSGERNVAFLWHTAPQKSVEDARQQETIVGQSGNSIMMVNMYNRVLGTKFKIIRGYPSTNDVILAIQRGEVQGMGSYSWSNIPAKNPDWIKDKLITVLYQSGAKRAPELPDVPLVSEIVQGDENRQILELWTSPDTVARPIAMPPGVPADRVAAVRAAFMAMVDSDDYVADAKKQGMDVDAQPGSEIDKLYEKLNKIPASTVEAARAVAN